MGVGGLDSIAGIDYPIVVGIVNIVDKHYGLLQGTQ